MDGGRYNYHCFSHRSVCIMSNTPTPSKTEQPGRPLMKFDLERVEELASRGLSLKQLAIALGVNLKTIQKHKKINASSHRSGARQRFS